MDVNYARQTPGTTTDSAAAAARAAACGRDGSSPPAAAAAGSAAVAKAAAAGHSISIAALLQQLIPPGSSAAGDGDAAAAAAALAGCLQQLAESARDFTGVSWADIPASFLLTNYIAETGDRAQQCLAQGRAAAGAALQRDGTAADAAECSAVLQDVKGLLQLSVQPVVRQLFGQQQVHKLIRGLLSCKQQLVDTLVECARQASLRIRQR